MADQKSLLVFFTDQQRWDTCGCYGGPMNLTPNLDALAARGVRFEHSFTCQPVCAPARGSLQTGRHGTAHSVWRNGLALPDSERTLAHCFGDAGYDLGYLGKWHLSCDKDQPVPLERRGGYTGYWEGADILEFTSHPYDARWFDENNNEVHYEGYRVDAQTDRAVEFLRSPRRHRPFFFFISYLEPHHQNDMDEFVGPERYAKSYLNPWIPPDLQNRPGDWYKGLPGYYGCVKALDDALGRIVDTLEETGQLDNTVILFTSDHGCHFRTRNAEYKRSCHEGCVRTPCVMAGPGVDSGKVVPELVSLVDMPPTLLSAAGLPIPETMQGRDAMPLARGENSGWANEVFIQISESEVGRAIRTDRWKYSIYAPEANGWQVPSSDRYVERYLYDLHADPHEQINLAGRKDHDAVRQDLNKRLIAQMTAAGEAEPVIEDARYYA